MVEEDERDNTLQGVLVDLEQPIIGFARRHADDWEDMAQEGRIGVLKAHPRWDSKHGTPASVFCWYRAMGSMRDHYRKSHNAVRHLPATCMVSTDEHEWIKAVEPRDHYAAVDARVNLAWVATLCTPTQIEVMTMYLQGKNSTEVAAARGTSISASSQALAEIRKRVHDAPVPDPHKKVRTTPAPPTPVPRRTVRAKDQPWWGGRLPYDLTYQEQKLLQHVADGKSWEQIAKIEFIVASSWKYKFKVISKKMGVNSTDKMTLIVAAFRAGLID